MGEEPVHSELVDGQRLSTVALGQLETWVDAAVDVAKSAGERLSDGDYDQHPKLYENRDVHCL
jgi:hypothetical protein